MLSPTCTLSNNSLPLFQQHFTWVFTRDIFRFPFVRVPSMSGISYGFEVPAFENGASKIFGGNQYHLAHLNLILEEYLIHGYRD